MELAEELRGEGALGALRDAGECNRTKLRGEERAEARGVRKRAWKSEEAFGVARDAAAKSKAPGFLGGPRLAANLRVSQYCWALTSFDRDTPSRVTA